MNETTPQPTPNASLPTAVEARCAACEWQEDLLGCPWAKCAEHWQPGFVRP